MGESEFFPTEEETRQFSGWLTEADPRLMEAIINLANHPGTVKNPEDTREGTVSDAFLRILEREGEPFFQAGKELKPPSREVLLETDWQNRHKVKKIRSDQRFGGFCAAFEANIGPIKSHWWLLDIWRQRIGREIAMGLSHFVFKRERPVRQLIVFGGVREAVSRNIDRILEDELEKRTQDCRIISPPEGNPLPAIHIPRLAYLLGVMNRCDFGSGKCLGELKRGKFDDEDRRMAGMAIFCRKVGGFHRFGKTMKGVWQALDKGDFDLAKEELTKVIKEFPYAFKEEDCSWLTGQGREAIAAEVRKRYIERKSSEWEERGKKQRRSLSEIQEEYDELRNRLNRVENFLFGLGIFKENAVEELGKSGLGTVRLIESVVLENNSQYFVNAFPLKERGSLDRLPGKFCYRLITFAQLWLVNEENQTRFRRELETKGYSEVEIEEVFEFIEAARNIVDIRLPRLKKLMKERRKERL